MSIAPEITELIHSRSVIASRPSPQSFNPLA
jgi:hypothetical protein